jgi:hypothetical protein
VEVVEQVVIELHFQVEQNYIKGYGSFSTPITVGAGGTGGATGSTASSNEVQERIQYFQQLHQQVEVVELMVHKCSYRRFRRIRWRRKVEILVAGGAQEIVHQQVHHKEIMEELVLIT